MRRAVRAMWTILIVNQQPFWPVADDAKFFVHETKATLYGAGFLDASKNRAMAPALCWLMAK